MSLPPPDTLLTILRSRGHRAAKSIGQHFLRDERLLDRIAECAATDADTLAVEIGSGPLTLTSPLSDRAGAVLGIEYDTRFQSFHAAMLRDAPNVRILYEDALRADLHGLAREEMRARGLRRAVLTGNLPFQITSPLLFAQTGGDAPWERMAVMVQKEVGDRIAAGPGGRTYGILTVKLAYRWRVTERFYIPADAFSPRPKVDAAMIVLEPETVDPPGPDEWKTLSGMIDAAFNQRRKKLSNSLSSWRGVGRERVADALSTLGLGADVRAENLSPDDFRALCRMLTTDPGEETGAAARIADSTAD